MKIFLLLTFYLVVQGNNQNQNIVFDLADLTIDIETDDKIVQIEAFKTSSNDAIIQSGNEEKYGQLTWVSLGHPKLFNFSRDLSIFKPIGFNLKVELLNNQLRQKFCQIIEQKYKIKVKTSQIVTLIPRKIECQIEIYDENYQLYIIKGTSFSLFKFPLYILFEAPVASLERSLIEKRILSGEDFEIHCEATFRGLYTKENVFTITGRQINSLSLVNSIFGPADTAYVTRNQLASLSHHLFMQMNVFEEYQVPEKEFSREFVQNLALMSNFQPVPIDECLKHMSSYDLSQDLNPNLIKEDLSKIFKVVSDGQTEKIVLNKDYASKTSNSSDFMIKGGLKVPIKGIPVEINANYSSASKNQDQKASSNWSNTLKQMNSDENSDIEWMRKGNMIVPKSINASKLEKANFKKDLKFSRIKKIVTDAPFGRTFSLNTKNINFIRKSNNQSMEIRNTLNLIESLNSKLDFINKWIKEQRNNQLMIEDGTIDISLNDFDQKYLNFSKPFKQEPVVLINFFYFSSNFNPYFINKNVTNYGFVYKLSVNDTTINDEQIKINWIAIGF